MQACGERDRSGTEEEQGAAPLVGRGAYLGNDGREGEPDGRAPFGDGAGVDKDFPREATARPEQGFELQGSALEVVKLCTATRTVAEIVDHLVGSHRQVERAQIAEDVSRLLGELMGRGLITTATGDVS